MNGSQFSLRQILEDHLLTILDVATAWTAPLSVERRFEIIQKEAEEARAAIREAFGE